MKTKIVLLAAIGLFLDVVCLAQTHGQDATSPSDVWTNTRYFEAIEAGASNRVYIGGRSSLAPISWGAYPDNNASVGLGVYRYLYQSAPAARICFANWANGSLNFDFSDDNTINSGGIVNWKNILNIQKNGQLTLSGSIQVLDGSNTTNFKVDNNGFLWARQVKVLTGTIPDYVFNNTYKLMPISELESYINKNKHLPNIRSAEDYSKENGVDIGELQIKLLEKVEELTLYVIKLHKQNAEMQKEICKLKKGSGSVK